MQTIENFFNLKYATESIDFDKTTEALHQFGSVFDPSYRTQRLILQVKKDPQTGKLILEAKKHQDISWKETFEGFFTGSFRIRNIFTVFQRVMAEKQRTSNSQDLIGKVSYPSDDSNTIEDSLVTCSILFHREKIRDTFSFLTFLVKQCHTDINKYNGLGRTPLIEAIIQHKDRLRDNTSLICCLINELGADSKKSDKKGKDPHSWGLSLNISTVLMACKTRAIKKPTQELNFNIKQLKAQPEQEKIKTAQIIAIKTSEELHRKVGLIWGLEGDVSCVIDSQTVNVHLEGSINTLLIPRIQPLINDFCKQPETTNELSVEEIAKFRQTFEQAKLSVDLECDFDGLTRKKEPLLIGHGVEGHAIGLVIYEDKIAVCNRGFRTTNAGVVIFQLKQALTSDILKNLLSKKDITEFNSTLTSLSHENPLMLDQKDQSVGNCSWASLKTTVQALLYIILKERPHLNEEAARQKSRALYKSFAIFSRIKSLEEYVNNPSPSKEIVQKLLVKVVQHKERFSQEQYTHLIQLLVEKSGADLNAAQKEKKIEKYPIPYLAKLVLNGDITALKKLTPDQANQTFKVVGGFISLLYLANCEGKTQAAHVLIERGAKTSASELNALVKRNDELANALVTFNPEVFKSFIKTRDQANQVIKFHETYFSLLRLATCAENINAVRFLIEKGARDLPNEEGLTALKTAEALELHDIAALLKSEQS